MKLPTMEQLGLPGVAGLGLLLFCLSFYFGSIMPAQAELAQLEADQTRLAAAMPAAVVAGAPGAPGQALPSVATAPELLLRLNAVAERHGLVATRAAYDLKTKDGQRRLQVSLPLTASYPVLRAYLRDALALAPAASLDELRLKRQRATDGMVEATILLSYTLGAAP